MPLASSIALGTSRSMTVSGAAFIEYDGQASRRGSGGDTLLAR